MHPEPGFTASKMALLVVDAGRVGVCLGRLEALGRDLVAACPWQILTLGVALHIFRLIVRWG